MMSLLMTNWLTLVLLLGFWENGLGGIYFCKISHTSANTAMWFVISFFVFVWFYLIRCARYNGNNIGEGDDNLIRRLGEWIPTPRPT